MFRTRPDPSLIGAVCAVCAGLASNCVPGKSLYLTNVWMCCTLHYKIDDFITPVTVMVIEQIITCGDRKTNESVIRFCNHCYFRVRSLPKDALHSMFGALTGALLDAAGIALARLKCSSRWPKQCPIQRDCSPQPALAQLGHCLGKIFARSGTWR